MVFATDVPEVYADPDKLTQVLTNLVENACKYASPVGLTVTAEVLDGAVAVSVADRGEGIPPSDLPKVFDKFFRRDLGRPTGSGLGLWISRGLVQVHGGKLTASSVPGEGTTFRFTLPLYAFEDLHGSGAATRPSGGEREAPPSGGEREAPPSGGEREAPPNAGEREAPPSAGEPEAAPGTASRTSGRVGKVSAGASSRRRGRERGA